MVLTHSFSSDTGLVEALKNGDIDSFKILYNKYKQKMYNTALRIHRNHLDAEDSIQETFVKVFKNIKSFEEKSSLSTWIFRILVNTCLGNIRKNKKLDGTDAVDFTEEMEQEKLKILNGNPALKYILEKEIKKLPVELRTVFILYEVEGFKHIEISEIMDIPVGTSKSHLFKAKKILRKYIEPYYKIFKEMN